LVAACEVHVHECLTQGVGDFSQLEPGLTMWSKEENLRNKRCVGEDTVAPSVGRFLFAGGVGGFLKSEIVLKNGIHRRKIFNCY
jgi:hypothetical protein